MTESQQKALKLLKELNLYFSVTRRTGHTNMASGNKDPEKDGILVVENFRQSKNIPSLKNKVKYITIDEVVNGGLRGYKMPLSVDHTVISFISNCLANLEVYS